MILMQAMRSSLGLIHVERDEATGAPRSASDGWWLLVCVVLALALRLYLLRHQSLWLDEVLTYRSAQIPLTEVWTWPDGALYHVLTHFVLLFGQGELALRLPSVVFGTLAIPLLYSVARPWMGARAARIGALLLAASPLHVWYSQEARPYALLLTLALLALWCAQRLLARPWSPVPVAGFVFSSTATFYAHIVALPFLGALALHVWLAAPRADRWRWIGLFGLVGLAMIPVVVRFTTTPFVSANPFQQFEPAHLAYTLWAFGVGYSLGPSLMELRNEGIAAVWRTLILIGPILTLLAGLIVLGLVAVWRRQREVFWSTVAWFVFPIAFAAIGAILTPHPFNVRYALLGLPALVVLLGAAIGAVRSPALRSAATVTLLVVFAASLAGYYYDPRYHREDTRAAVEFLNARAAPGDLVIVSAAYMTIPVDYYRPRPNLVVVGYPSGTTQQEKLGAGYVDAARVPADLDALISGRSGVWVFLSRTFHSDPDGHIARYLDSRFQRAAEFRAAGVLVAHFKAQERAVRGEEQ